MEDPGRKFAQSVSIQNPFQKRERRRRAEVKQAEGMDSNGLERNLQRREGFEPVESVSGDGADLVVA